MLLCSNEQLVVHPERPKGMSAYDEYKIVINEAQRRLIMRALTNAMVNDRYSTDGGVLKSPNGR